MTKMTQCLRQPVGITHSAPQFLFFVKTVLGMYESKLLTEDQAVGCIVKAASLISTGITPRDGRSTPITTTTAFDALKTFLHAEHANGRIPCDSCWQRLLTGCLHADLKRPHHLVEAVGFSCAEGHLYNWKETYRLMEAWMTSLRARTASTSDLSRKEAR